MHIDLIEWYGNSGLVEFQLDVFLHIEEDFPVVSAAAPDLRHEFYAAVRVFVDKNFRGGALKDFVAIFRGGDNRLACLFDIV